MIHKNVTKHVRIKTVAFVVPSAGDGRIAGEAVGDEGRELRGAGVGCCRRSERGGVWHTRIVECRQPKHIVPTSLRSQEYWPPFDHKIPA